MNMNRVLNILITGASSGIGLALAQEYLKQGHKVFALARSEEKLAALQLQHPEQVTPLVADISVLDQVTAVKNQLVEKTDYLDLIILNAGTCEYIDAKNFLSSSFNTVDRVNWKGNLNCLEVFLPVLLAAKQYSRVPHLVGVSSLAAILPLPRSEAYGASKVAFEYLLKSLQVDLYSQGLKMTIVRPGFVDTPLTQVNDFDMPFITSSEKAAGIIVKGIAAQKNMIQFPATLVWVMKLIALLPFALQKRILQKVVRKEV
jgi:short-subunit dehydrogenase